MSRRAVLSKDLGQRLQGLSRIQDSSFSQILPFWGCFFGTFSPSCLQIRSTRLWFTGQPSALRSRRVTSKILFGALSVYLLIGLTFALVFTTLEARHPGSLSLPAGAFEAGLVDPRPFSTISYFSFVTMTTLGYGDIGPLTPATRSLVTLEALLGQLFLAVLMARLVALHILHESGETQNSEGS